MCKRHTYNERISTVERTAPQAYEGETVRLSQVAPVRRVSKKHACGGAWHLLWLIWPATIFLKSMAATAPHTLSVLVGAWLTLLPLQIIGALAIVALGVALLRRERRSQGESRG